MNIISERNFWSISPLMRNDWKDLDILMNLAASYEDVRFYVVNGIGIGKNRFLTVEMHLKEQSEIDKI